MLSHNFGYENLLVLCTHPYLLVERLHAVLQCYSARVSSLVEGYHKEIATVTNLTFILQQLYSIHTLLPLLSTTE